MTISKTTQPELAPALIPFIALHGLMHILATTLPALSPLVKAEFQLTNTAVGVLSFAFAAAIGLGSIFSGMLSDRYDGIRLISLGFFSTATLSAFLFLSYDFLSLTLTFIAMGFFLSFYHPSALSHIANSFKIRRGKVFGVHETGGSIGIAITPLIAALISFYAEWRFVYLFWAFPTFFFAFLLLKLMKKRDFFSNANANDMKLSVFIKQIISTGSIRRIYVIEGLFGFVFGGSLTFIPIFLNEAKGLSPDLAVMLTCVFTGGGAIGKFVGGHFSDLVGGRKVMVYGFFLTAPLFFSVPFLPLLGAILALALAGLIFPTILPAIITTIGKEVPPSRTGIAFGLMMFAGFGFGSTSRPLLGLISDSFGISTVFYPIVIAVLIGGFLNVCMPLRPGSIRRGKSNLNLK
ncbi:MAG: MFS transporter [Methanophagales archaeon]|nr:MFS transporter [Methanophagales archaeon]MCW3141515.1 MFS transporter [Methanophagales archaeon]